MRKLLIALMIVVSIGASGVVRAQDWERATKAFRSAAVTARTSPSFLRCNGSPSSSSTTVRNWIDCFGTFTLFGGNKYIGDFRNGKFDGQGTYIYGPLSKWAGSKYVGEWKGGKRHGQGTFTYAPSSEWAGNKYVGEIRNDKFYGHDTFTYADGRVAKGTWENNKFLYAQEPRRTDSDKGVR